MVEKGYERMAQEIKVDFSNREYALRSGDIGLEAVPESLWWLWYGRGKIFPTVSELDYCCLLCREGRLTEIECIYMFTALRTALSYEFGLLDKNKANLMKGVCK